MLSRLVRDNGFSMQWAARIIEYEDGQKSAIYTPGHEGKGTYRLRRDREWLDGPEAEVLARLFAAFRGAEQPDRVGRAMWRCEYATWQRYTDVALPMMVGGLEALLGLGRSDTSRRIKNRLAAMASELGIDGVDGDLLDRMYEGRSAWVHGSPVRLFDPAADPEREPDAQPDAAMEAALTEIVKCKTPSGQFCASRSRTPSSGPFSRVMRRSPLGGAGRRCVAGVIKPSPRISGTRAYECPNGCISAHIRTHSRSRPSAVPPRSPCK